MLHRHRQIFIALAEILALFLSGLGAALGQSMRPNALPCAPDLALKTEIAGISAEGIIEIKDGYRLRLANIVWPDHLEPGLRGQLVGQLKDAMSSADITWKPAAGPDRWGITPAHLFLNEREGKDTPFWLQGGLVENGLVPAWPEPLNAECWTRLQAHEYAAIRTRRGYWAPRNQTARHRAIETDRDSHAGRPLVALWRVARVRSWRSLTFVNFTPSFRGGHALALTQKQMTSLRQAGRDPARWQGKWLTTRFILGSGGLSRIRIETPDHVGALE